jgi:hypothetical protein
MQHFEISNYVSASFLGQTGQTSWCVNLKSFPCNPILPLAFNIWLLQEVPASEPEGILVTTRSYHCNTCQWPSNLELIFGMKDDVCSVSDLPTFHLHDGFIPGIYRTVLKQDSWGKYRIWFYFHNTTLSYFTNVCVCYFRS